MLKRAALAARGTLAPFALATAMLVTIGCVPQPSSSGVSFSQGTARAVLKPARFVWLSARQDTGFLPSSVRVGGKTSGRVLLYFEFPQLETSKSQLLRAFLILETADAHMKTEQVDVKLTRAQLGRESMRSWGDQPRAVSPRLSAKLTGRGSPQRVDVTELVQASLDDRQVTRMMLLAEPGDAEGLLIATGASGGAAPRLEVYWK